MILTAAHCVYNIPDPNDMEAFFGFSSKDEILKKSRLKSLEDALVISLLRNLKLLCPILFKSLSAHFEARFETII